MNLISLDVIKRRPYYFQMFANRLNMLVTLMLAIALLVMGSESAQKDGYHHLKFKRNTVEIPQRYCGKRLSSALQVICDGVYNSMFKKSDNGDNGSNDDDGDDHGEFKLIDRENIPIARINTK